MISIKSNKNTIVIIQALAAIRTLLALFEKTWTVNHVEKCLSIDGTFLLVGWTCLILSHRWLVRSSFPAQYIDADFASLSRVVEKTVAGYFSCGNKALDLANASRVQVGTTFVVIYGEPGLEAIEESSDLLRWKRAKKTFILICHFRGHRSWQNIWSR